MTKSSFSKFFRRGVFMYWCLLGVLVVIIGFAIKLEPIAIIVVSAIVTAIFGGINVIDLLETVGTTFLALKCEGGLFHKKRLFCLFRLRRRNIFRRRRIAQVAAAVVRSQVDDQVGEQQVCQCHR